MGSRHLKRRPMPRPGWPTCGPPRTNGAGHRAGPPRGTRARSPAPSATLGGSSLPALPLTRDLPQGGQRPPPPSPLWRPRGRGRLCYQVPVYAAEECVGLDVGESGLRPAAEPLFGVLGINEDKSAGSAPASPDLKGLQARLRPSPADTLPQQASSFHGPWACSGPSICQCE